MKSPMVGRCLSHWESQARWQSQNRWLECRRLQGMGGDREAHNPPGSPAPGNIGAEPLRSAGVGGRAPGTPLGHTLTELTDTLPSNHLTHLQTQKQIICHPRETSNIKGIQRPSLLDHSPSSSPTQPPPWGDLWGRRGGQALPTPTTSPNTFPTGRCALGRLGLTHKVRSLGMWLKLDTGMVVMLLLFRVLSGGEPRSLSIGPAGSCAGSGGTWLLSHRAPTVHPRGPSWAGPGGYARKPTSGEP